MKIHTLLQKLTPTIRKKYVLFVAAFVWTFAGVMLLFRGFYFLFQTHESVWAATIISLLVGVLFYFFVFSKVSLKHSMRIIHLTNERPCVFSFFSGRSYLLMFLMISLGVITRKSGIIPLLYLSEFYIVMGTPLLLSALRFYYYGMKYSSFKEKAE